MKKSTYIVFAIFLLAIGLRLVLAIVNRSANDDHVEVIRWIVEKQTIPGKNDCIECYQPKFFYITSAAIVNFFHLSHRDSQTVAVQLFNTFISFFTLLCFWNFIKSKPLTERAKILFFAFFAFNPGLAGINVQATNDTLVIFAGVLSVYCADLFFRENKLSAAIGLLMALLIAALTKANGLLFAAIISSVFIVKIFASENNRRRLVLLRYLLIGLAVFLSIVPLAGGYYDNYKKYNSLTTSAWGNDPPPLFFENTYIARPGVSNMFEGFFTFRYFDMVRHPYITNGSEDYPLHRTSLWSQLYGRTVFLHFDQWPPLWQTENISIINVGRILILLGLVPLALFLAGVFHGIYDSIKSFLNHGKTYLLASNDYLYLIITVAFLLCSLKYSYNIRDFSAMKSIYLFPGFICYIKHFLDGYSSIRSKMFTGLSEIVLLAMIFLSIFDILFLIYQHF